MPIKKNKKGESNLLHIIKNHLFIMRIALKEAPAYVIFKIVQPANQRIEIYIEHVWLIGYLIDCVANQRPFHYALFAVLGVFLYSALTEQLMNALQVSYINPTAIEKVNQKLRNTLYTKAVSLDLASYDDPVFYNSFVWAMSEADKKTEEVLTVTGNIVGWFLTILISAGYILSIEPSGAIFIIVSTIGIICCRFYANKIQLRMKNDLKEHERKRDYVARVFYLSDHAKELRLNHVKNMLYKEFDDSSEQMEQITRKHTIKITVLGILSDIVFGAILIYGVYLALLLYKSMLLGSYTIGVIYTLFRSSTQAGAGLLKLGQLIPQSQEVSLYIDKIRSFLNKGSSLKNPEIPLECPKSGNLELRDVTFSYFGKKVLEHVSLTIQPGEKIAIVGYNGAGKTTLVKLLMRLYDVDEGEILYAGHNIRDYRLNEYREVFATVFQDYQLFAATVSENIVMDVASPDEERLDEVLDASGFKEILESLPMGVNTQLTREFDEEGVLLSGGEAQKLVIARALYKNSSVLVLDEPSSALDPIAEYQLNKTMMMMGEDKTVIMISHRLSTTMHANCIYVMDSGRVIEQGTHDELMRLQGKYAYMFDLQAEKYRQGA